MKRLKSFVLCLVFCLFSCSFFGCGEKNNVQTATENANLYEIVASFDEINHQVQATQVLHFKNSTGQKLHELKFHLHPNAFSEDAKTHKAISQTQEQKAFEGETSFGKIEIQQVLLSGKTTEFEFEDEEKQILSINLLTELCENQQIDAEIQFLVVLPNAKHRFGYGQNTINLGNWFPILCYFQNGSWDTETYDSSGDPFFSDISNFLVTFSFPSKFILASTGEVVCDETKNEIKTTTLNANAVRDFAMVLSEEFEVLSEDVDGTKVSYYYFDDQNAKAHQKTCVDALKTFNRLFGTYPYKTLNVAKANFLHGGMEFPNLVLVSSDVSNDAEFSNVIVHEIAHQWWYGIVGNDQKNCAWIDEGLAEFSTALFYDENQGYEFSYNEVLSNALSSYLLFCDVYTKVYDDFNPAINRPVSTFKTEMEYTYITYVKSLLMFDSLQDAIGKAKMKKCLQALFKNFAFQEATPNKFVQCFEKASHRKIQSFFDSWLNGTVVLEELA